MSESNIYKRVCVYDAELKKNRGYTIKRKDFKDDEEMAAYIKMIKDKQRKKNKEYKEKLVLKKNADLIGDYTNLPIENIKFKARPEVRDNIDNFKLDIGTGNTTFIFGSSKTGKTTLMMELYRKYYKDDKELISTLFSGNAQMDQYKNYKDLLIGDGFNSKSEKYIKMQKYINLKTNNEYKFLNMFDDIINTKYSQLMSNLVMTYRNSNISTIMLLQYGKLLSKANRANANNIFIFRSHNMETKKDMIELFLKDKFIQLGILTGNDMLKYYDEVTENYGFFYIHTSKEGFMTTHRLRM